MLATLDHQEPAVRQQQLKPSQNAYRSSDQSELDKPPLFAG